LCEFFTDILVSNSKKFVEVSNSSLKVNRSIES
jgi:hypothetical protein